MPNSALAHQQQRQWFRKSLVIPAEHGSWSWLLVPYFVGVIVAGHFGLASLLVLVGGFSGFLVRQPLTAWLRIRAGRGRQSQARLAAVWSLGLAMLSLLCLMGLMALGVWDLLWLIFPSIGVFLLYLLAALQKRTSTRTLGMEVAGAAGLAVMAPAAYIASAGVLDSTAWLLWLLMAGQNTDGVMYVRLRIADTHSRMINRSAVIIYHILVFLVLAAAALRDWVPLLAVLPFAVYLLRALWAFVEVRPVQNIKRFGFTEVGVEIAGGILIAAAWLI